MDILGFFVVIVSSLDLKYDMIALPLLTNEMHRTILHYISSVVWQC